MLPLAARYTAPFPSITAAHVDACESWIRNSSQWVGVGAFRALQRRGELWVKPLRAQPRWAERTSVLRLLRLAAARRPALEFDLVYFHHDKDPTPKLSALALPLFTNAHAAGRASIPLPDYSWMGWGARTPPWCEQFPTLAAAAAATPWEARADRAFFSGGLRSGASRVALGRLRERPAAAALLELRDVAPAFFSPKRGMNSGRAAPLPQAAACGYRYLLSVPGHGYSNRLKSLLACGSVVLHVPYPAEEWFVPLLTPGVDYVRLASVKDVVPALLALRRNASAAKSIAAAALAFAQRHLRFDSAVEYTADVLAAYAERWKAGGGGGGGGAPAAPYRRVRSAADTGDVLGLCDCAAPGAQCGRLKCCAGWDCPKAVCES